MAETLTRPPVSYLVIEKPGLVTVGYEPAQAELQPGQIRIDTEHTALSAGTFMSFYNGTNPKSEGWDPNDRVFRPGPPDPRDKYPKREGYMGAGVVSESRDPAFKEGTFVSGAYDHTSQHIANAGDAVIALPDGFNRLTAPLVAQFAPVCANGVLTAADEMTRRSNLPTLERTLAGKRAVVMGAGMIGLVTAIFAKRAGAEEVVVVDMPDQVARLEAAQELGMTVLTSNPDLGYQIKEHFPGKPSKVGADIGFECTGNDKALNKLYVGMCQQGTVIDMGFAQGGAPNLMRGKEWHHNQLRGVSAQYGAMPFAQAEVWDRARLRAYSRDILFDEGPKLEAATNPLVVPLSEAPVVIGRLASRDNTIVQAVFYPDKPGPQAA